jgi:hypothetical protein
MPRSKRVAAVGAAHRVTERGNGRQEVFVNILLRSLRRDSRMDAAAQR